MFHVASSTHDVTFHGTRGHMARPQMQRATVEGVLDQEDTTPEDAPIVAATNTHDHSTWIRLADGSRLRIDRDFAELAFQAVRDSGIVNWRNPTEMMRACLSIGLWQVCHDDRLREQLEIQADLNLAIESIAEIDTIEQQILLLETQGRAGLARAMSKRRDALVKVIDGVERKHGGV